MDLEDAARELNRSPVAEPAPVDHLINRARSRRRSRQAATAFGGLTTAVALLAFVVAVDGRPADEQVSTSATTSARTPLPLRIDPPAALVAHLRQVGNDPGPIVVMRSDDGAVLRSLGAAYDPYVGNGFHTSADAVYWQQLDEPAQRFPVTEARLSDGATRKVTEGSLNLPSPDGTRLLVRLSSGSGSSAQLRPVGNTYAVIGLSNLDHQQLPDPDLNGQQFISASWLPDGHTVLALSRDMPPSQRGCRPISVCAPTTTSQAAQPTRAWSIDTTTTSATWRPLANSTSWADVEVLGPGRLPDTVAAVELIGNTRSIITISSQGQVIDRLPAAPYTVLAVDHTGTNFLVEQDGELARTALADPTAIRIGPAVAQATWW